jgi:lysophospholipase
MRWTLFLASAVCLAAADPACAIPEQGYVANYSATVLPFLSSGEHFTFRSADGVTNLQGVRFLHPKAKGMIVVVNGSTESWLKYGEFFYDLYQRGYSICSYDHRGQGLSPRLVPANHQIVQIDDFSLYAADLNCFVEQEILPGGYGKLYLLGHSMGGAVALDYLERYPSPFRSVVLSSPMLRINTSPYPELVARSVVALFCAIGLGDHYAIGMHDWNPREPFTNNKLTSSRSRWDAIQHIWSDHPEAVAGGPSNDWVKQSINHTSLIRGRLPEIKSSVLILQAGKDQWVMNPDQEMAQAKIPGARLARFPGAQHEILMERDTIRDQAIEQMDVFFRN